MNGSDDGDVVIARHRYYRRQFINRPGHHSTAFIHAVVDRSRVSDEYGGDTTLEISDCCRKISLSIDQDSEQARENSLHKLDTLIESLVGFRRAFKEECAVQVRRERKRSRRKPR